MLQTKLTVPFYGHVRQYHNIKAEIDAKMAEVLESGQYVLGPMLKSFEQELAQFHGARYAIGVGNGTDALWLTFQALGVAPGDECITTTNTFFATAEAIWVTGATAVFVDSDPRTNCIDPAEIERAITARTKLLVPVHLYGQCADMKAVRKIADKHGLKVVEDNAQAICGRGDGFQVGELTDAATTSFIIQKNLGTFGDGGAVVTNNPEIERVVRKLRNHGSEKRSCHSMGYNSRLDDLHAAVLSAKLKHIAEWSELRRKWAARYTAGLADVKNITLPYETPGYYHVYHLYVVETKQAKHRDAFLQFLNEAGIDAKCHYPIAIHQQEGYPWGHGARIAGPIPNSERNAACCISLPMFPELIAEEVDYTIEKVLEWDRSTQ